MTWKLALLVAVTSCRSAPAVVEDDPPRSRGSLSGFVRTPTGEPPPDGTFVLVTDTLSGLRRSVFKVGPNGAFSFEIAAGEYALAVTAPTGFLYLEKIAVPTHDLSLSLVSECHVLRGTVKGSLKSPAVVNMTRVSPYIGDRFVSPVRPQGEFVACLPEATYLAQVDDAMVSLGTPITLPTNAVVEIAAYPRSAIQEAPDVASIASTDFATFARSLIDRRIIGLGEANHGTGDFYVQRGRLSLELARIGRLRAVLMEADALAMMSVDDYVMGRAIDPAKAVADIRFWVTDIQEFLGFLEEVRSYNAKVSQDRKVHVLGVDAQRIEPPIKFMLDHRDQLGIDAREFDLLAKIAPNRGAAFADMPQDAADLVFSALDRLASSAASSDLATIDVRASIAARSARSQLRHRGKPGARDLVMSELAVYLSELLGPAQTALWAHNAHIACQLYGANKSLGQHLCDRLGKDYYPVAFLSYRGSARAWDAAGQIGVIPHELLAAPAYNLESVVMTATQFADVAWVRLDTATGHLAQWLSFPRYVREFGSAFAPDDTQALRTFPEALSAVVVIRDTRPSTPTATGVRMIKK